MIWKDIKTMGDKCILSHLLLEHQPRTSIKDKEASGKCMRWRQQTGVRTGWSLQGLTRHISMPYHHLPPYTPSGKVQQGGGGDRWTSSHLWFSSPEEDALALPHSSWGFKVKGCFPHLCPLSCPVRGVGESLTETTDARSKWICDVSLLQTSV